MLVRHAEKPTGSGGPFGVTAHGLPDEESLTIRGWARAGALAALFAPVDGKVRAGLEVPRALFASDAHRKKGSRRPAQTIAELADRLGLTVDTSYQKGDVARLVAAVRTAEVSLISWQHEEIPAIVAGLGTVHPPAPATWPEDRYDVVWVLRSTDGSNWEFSQVPQQLLAGDGAEPIG